MTSHPPGSIATPQDEQRLGELIQLTSRLRTGKCLHGYMLAVMTWKKGGGKAGWAARTTSKLFPNLDAGIAAVRKRLASAGSDFYEHRKHALVHRWQKCITNGSNYAGNDHVGAELLLLPNSAVLSCSYLSVSIVSNTSFF